MLMHAAACQHAKGLDALLSHACCAGATSLHKHDPSPEIRIYVCLVQVEELVAGSNTGKAPQLADYYSYWEMAVFNALVLMVLKGLEKLHSMLTKKPLFKASDAPLLVPLAVHRTVRRHLWLLSMSDVKDTAMHLFTEW